MEVHLTAETEKKLKDLAAQSGRGTDDLVEEAMAGYFDEVLQIRETLDSRYDDLKSGRVKPIDGEEAFASLKAKTEAEWDHQRHQRRDRRSSDVADDAALSPRPGSQMPPIKD